MLPELAADPCKPALIEVVIGPFDTRPISFASFPIVAFLERMQRVTEVLVEQPAQLPVIVYSDARLNAQAVSAVEPHTTLICTRLYPLEVAGEEVLEGLTNATHA